MAQVRGDAQRAAAARCETASIARALTPWHACLDCGCLPDASRGLCSPLLCEHATAVTLRLRAVSCLAALSDALACCPRRAAAVLLGSPPLATSEIGFLSRRARLSSPAAKASQLSANDGAYTAGRGQGVLHSEHRIGPAAHATPVVGQYTLTRQCLLSAPRLPFCCNSCCLSLPMLLRSTGVAPSPSIALPSPARLCAGQRRLI